MGVYNANSNDTTPFYKLAAKQLENPLEAARLYTGMGIAVTPCEGKKAILPGWPERKLREEELPEHFTDGRNVALVLGEPSSELVNVDLDVPEAVEISDRFLPDTLSGGRTGAPRAHLYYRVPEARTRKWHGTDGAVLLEQRSTGCQTLVEPSLHPSGERYLWDRQRSPLEPVELAPEDLDRRCKGLATATAIARCLPPVGGRHQYAMAVIGCLLRRLDMETTRELVLAAWHAGDGDSADAVGDLQGIVEDTSRRLAAGDSAFGWPTLEETAPGLPRLLDKWWGRESGERHNERNNESKKEGAPTQDELRDLWLDALEAPTAYGQGEWRRYGSGIWEPVHQQIILREIDEVLEAAKPEGVRPTAGTRSSIEKLAQAKTFVPDEHWDANPDILVCANGTLEISGGILRPHLPRDYSLSALPFDYDPEAEAPAWEAFLGSTLPEPVCEFLKEFAGYSLTTDTAYELAVWLHGPPGSGKSTFIEGLKAMLGERVGVLGLADLQNSRFALADLPGKTLLTATEQPSDYLRSTHILNTIISGEEIKVEQKFKAAYTVIPRAKILWAMNELPRIGDANSGLFRRVKLVTFPKLDEEKRDEKVKEAIKGEGAGILNWALEGLNRVRERGHFEIPDSVREATEEFRLSNDLPAMFVKEACITSSSVETKEQANTLYQAYRRWCEQSGHKPISRTKIAGDWKRLGFSKATLNGRTYYRGVEVDPEWRRSPDDFVWDD